jgi:hypothetical protein
VSGGRALRVAARYGFAGGLCASLVMVVPASLSDAATTPLGDLGGTLVVLLAVHAGMRAATAAEAFTGFGRRIGIATVIATGASAIVAVGLYALYAAWRPGLLAARYALYEQRLKSGGGAPAGRAAFEVARLAARKAQYLDPAFQAIAAAGTIFFFAMLFGAYAAWHFRVAARLRAGRSSRRR